MDTIKLDKSVKSVVLLNSTDSGARSSETLYKAKKAKKKKQSKMLKLLEKSLRKSLKTQAKVAEDYLERHDRSNKKKRDGWVRDVVKNVGKAFKKSDIGSFMG